MPRLHLFAFLACGLSFAASDPADYRISGPYTHDNLSIFLIHAKDPGGQSNAKSYVTLQEALEQKKVVLYETQNVNELAIENLSDHDVFVQGGDIVKGGQQDRVISNDFVLPGKSGRLPISAFCVEPGRWHQRGAEPAKMFSVSTQTISNPDLARAVKVKKNQSEVWNEVAKTQGALAFGVQNRSAGQAGAMAVRADASPSSLQLTLESKPVTKAIEGYVTALQGAVDQQTGTVGFAFAVNGKIVSADVYASPALFQAMWPKLLKSSAIEAVRAVQKGQKTPPPTASSVNALLANTGSAPTSTLNVGRVALISREADKQLIFESRDGDSLIHRNYIAK